MSIMYDVSTSYSQNVVRNIYDKYNLFASSEKLKEILEEELELEISSENYNIHDVFNHIITSNYPGEINVKAKLFKHLMNNKKKVTIFEVPLGRSRADVMAINGESVIYEIKTEIDTLNRLNDQISNYYQYAEKVYVVCTKKDVKKVVEIVSPNTGIILYNKNNKNIVFSYYRKAVKSNTLCSTLQLESMDAKHLNKLLKTDSYLPKSVCVKNLIQKYSTPKVNLEFKKYLKDKYLSKFSFVKNNIENINEIDIQTFFKANINPKLLYK